MDRAADSRLQSGGKQSYQTILATQEMPYETEPADRIYSRQAPRPFSAVATPLDGSGGMPMIRSNNG